MLKHHQKKIVTGILSGGDIMRRQLYILITYRSCNFKCSEAPMQNIMMNIMYRFACFWSFYCVYPSVMKPVYVCTILENRHVRYTTPRTFDHLSIHLKYEKALPLAPYHPCYFSAGKIPSLAPHHSCYFETGDNSFIGTRLPLIF